MLTMRKMQRDEDITRAKSDIAAIRMAIIDYRDEYGQAPDTDSDLFRVLTVGENPKQISFLVPIDPTYWPENQYTDPWGRPYVFDLSQTNNPQIISLGPDGRLSADDITGVEQHQ